MNKYSVTYDLMKPGKDYDALIRRLQALGGKRIELSQWLICSDTLNAKAIRDDLQRFMDANDRLFVAGLTGEAAWYNLLTTDAETKQRLTA